MPQGHSARLAQPAAIARLGSTCGARTNGRTGGSRLAVCQRYTTPSLATQIRARSGSLELSTAARAASVAASG